MNNKDKKIKTVLLKLKSDDYDKLLKINSHFQELNHKKESFSETIKNMVDIFYSEKINK